MYVLEPEILNEILELIAGMASEMTLTKEWKETLYRAVLGKIKYI